MGLRIGLISLMTFVFFVGWPACGIAQDVPSQITTYDVRFYNPKESGVQDLAFEVRYDGLKEMIEDRLGVKNLIDVYFQVYWLMPGKFKIQVAGLPDGFEELRAELRAMVRSRLDLVIPSNLSSRLRGYRLTTQSIDGGVQVIGKDPTHSKVINELTLNFSNDGRLTRIRTQSPMGTNTTNLEMSPKSWSNNKWVLDKIKVRTIQGIQATTIEQEIEYKTEAGFGLPEKVEIKTTQQLIRPEDDEGETFEATDEAVIRFSNYRVNTGAAQKFIMSN